MNDKVLNKYKANIKKQILITIGVLVVFCVLSFIPAGKGIVTNGTTTTLSEDIINATMGIDRTNIMLMSVGIVPLIMAEVVVNILISIIPDLKLMHTSGKTTLIKVLKWIIFIIYAYMQAKAAYGYNEILLVFGSIICAMLARVITSFGIGKGGYMILATAILLEGFKRGFVSGIEIIETIALFIVIGIIMYKGGLSISLYKGETKKSFKLLMNKVSISPLFYSSLIMFIVSGITSMLHLSIKPEYEMIIMCVLIVLSSTIIMYRYVKNNHIGQKLLSNGYVVSTTDNYDVMIKIVNNKAKIVGVINGLFIISLLMLSTVFSVLPINPLSIVLIVDIMLSFKNKIDVLLIK